MATKSKQGNVRVPADDVRNIILSGGSVVYPSIPGNAPRISGVRTGNDKEFLKSNNGKLSKLQHIIA